MEFLGRILLYCEIHPEEVKEACRALKSRDGGCTEDWEIAVIDKVINAADTANN